MYNIIRKIGLAIVCKFLFRVRYKNTEILDEHDKCIICANHSRIYDPMFLYPKVENMYSMAKSELFKNKIIANFLKYHNVIPIDRENVDVAGVKRAIRLLKNKEKIKLLIFPEGKVIKEESQRGEIKDGAVFISAITKIPIIPVYITHRPRYFSKVVVEFKNAFIPDENVLKNRDILKSESQLLFEKLR